MLNVDIHMQLELIRKSSVNFDSFINYHLNICEIFVRSNFIVLFIALCFLLVPCSVNACLCQPASVETLFSEADLVFSGYVDQQFGNEYSSVFHVVTETMYKGRYSEAFKIKDGVVLHMCSVGLRPGKRVILFCSYSTADSSIYVTDLCAGSVMDGSLLFQKRIDEVDIIVSHRIDRFDGVVGYNQRKNLEMGISLYGHVSPIIFLGLMFSIQVNSLFVDNYSWFVSAIHFGPKWLFYVHSNYWNDVRYYATGQLFVMTRLTKIRLDSAYSQSSWWSPATPGFGLAIGGSYELWPKVELLLELNYDSELIKYQLGDFGLRIGLRQYIIQ